MNRLRNIFPLIISAIICSIASACIEDGITSSPSDQPVFSTDTLDFGDQFTDELTVTQHMLVYNRCNKILSISEIYLSTDDNVFMLNVDGQSGRRFSNVEIRPNDSIYLLVAAKFPLAGSYDPTDIDNDIVFVTNGVTSKVALHATRLDAETLTDPVIDTDTRWVGDHPRRINGTLTVAQGATLTLAPGTTLYFHDKSGMVVEGSLVTEGSAELPVILRGDRLGSVVGDISFDLMASQWRGVRFAPGSTDNHLSFTEIRNTTEGVIADTASLSLTNCRLRNSATNAMRATHSTITAVGCEFAESAKSPLLLHGGTVTISHTTLSNYYLFAAITGPLLQLEHTDADHNDESGLPYLNARIDNSILYGSSADINLKDLSATNVILTNCLLRSNGTDDNNFRDCIWGQDPMFNTVRADYIFDYRLKTDSPALGVATTSSLTLPPTDFYGQPHPSRPAIGAYELLDE